MFEAELTFEIPGDDGKPVRFGSVGGGGRYDGLVSRFRGEKVPATGFSIGVSRLAAALQKLGKLASAEPVGPVVVVPRTAALAPHCMRLVQTLRDDESLARDSPVSPPKCISAAARSRAACAMPTSGAASSPS